MTDLTLLKLYLPTFRLLEVIVDATESLPRNYKFTLGDGLMKAMLDCFNVLGTLGMQTKHSSGYMKALKLYKIKFQLVTTLIRLLSEKSIISTKTTSLLALYTSPILDKLNEDLFLSEPE